MNRPWTWTKDRLIQELSAPEAGLSPQEADLRLRRFGANEVKPARRGPLQEALLSQARNPLLWLLGLAGGLSALSGEVNDAVILLLILGLGSLLAVWQESRAGKALAALQARLSLKSTVLRGGQEVRVPTASVVPGDILILAAGTLVVADAVLLEAKNLYVSQALLTGEPFAARKLPGPTPPDSTVGERTGMVYAGSSVRSGQGRAMVVATGPKTAFGHLSNRLAARAPESEFTRGLRHFGMLLLNIMLVLVIFVFAVSAFRQHPRMEALLFAVALAVGLAPQMLPAVLSTMLSRGARRLAQGGVLVRRLETIENLGSMTCLCTDKTGTLTEGDIRLEQALDTQGAPCARIGKLGFWNAVLQHGLPNPLDQALVEAFSPDPGEVPVKLDELPFDFSRKRLSIGLRPAADEPPILVTKGAFESVLSVCTRVRRGQEVEPLDQDTLEALRAQAEGWSREGLRVLAVATKVLDQASSLDLADEEDEILEGFLTFRDPPKEGVAQVLQHLSSLGVRVKMVSGDHREVVRHLARELGWEDGSVRTGKELAGLKEEALLNLVTSSDLFAEVDPGQKERILLALKKQGQVVGFMGDGINDSPAIHAADVGISVQQAADVAREAADFVLLEQDLGLLRDGIREGRKIFANTMKYILTTESANLGNMLSMAGAALFLPFLPLLAHQVLLNNLLSDVPSTTLSADHVDEELLARPQRWDLGFLRRFMIGFGLISAAFDALTFLVLTLVFAAPAALFRTAWFVESLLTEVLVLLVLRTRRPFWKSRPHPALLLTSVVVAGVALALPLSPAGANLGFVRLPWEITLAVLGIAAAYALTVEAVKRPLLAHIEGSDPVSSEA